MNDTLTALDLPPTFKIQTLKLQARISQAASADELWRASHRAAGFVLGLETVEALNAASIEGLYGAFEEAATARRQDESQ